MGQRKKKRSRRYHRPVDVTVYQPLIGMMGKDCQAKAVGAVSEDSNFQSP